MSIDVLDGIVPTVLLCLLFLLPAYLKSLQAPHPQALPSDKLYYPSSPSDVFEVRRFLVKFLPPELVNTIIDDAGYWPRISCSSAERRAVIASYYPRYNAALRYLVTPAFPSSEELGGRGARLRVKQVNFKIRSNDQGWTSDLMHQGTYSGSYTWFEATILRPEQAPELLGWRRVTVALGFHGRRPSGPLLEVKNPAEPDGHWRVQTNRCASSVPVDHDIVWQDGASADLQEAGEENGSGDGAGFIETLAPGDRIGIIARAMYLGWVNLVRSVEVVVYYAV
ncbi:hypothetical protein B0H17DRAFT_939175 [Mycena rosella]|uniref:Uncharacterized protein n=1 Tax=Mycena rosella TaxID=1033263 RepID=A0AAD7GET9_MYCRO|nr:hypothetical protein B0H17DRAFT_939175 [Mycena rosella]